MVLDTCSPRRDALLRCPCSPGSRSPKDSVPCPQPSSVRRALCNRPARPGRHRDGPGAGGSLARSLLDKRPLHLLPLVPIPTAVGPAHGAPRSALPQHRDSHRPVQEKRGAGRSRGRQPGPRQLSVLPDTGSRARPAPRTGTAGPAPASAALSRARHRTEFSSRTPGRSARLTRAVPRPPPPRGVGLASAAGADGGAGPGAERRRGRNRPRAWSAQRAFPFPRPRSSPTAYLRLPRHQPPELARLRQRYLPRPASAGTREVKAGRQRSPKLTRRPSWARRAAAGGGGARGGTARGGRRVARRRNSAPGRRRPRGGAVQQQRGRRGRRRVREGPGPAGPRLELAEGSGADSE